MIICCAHLGSCARQVDETDVRVVHTFNPSSQAIENYNYPSPGTKNATSTLKLLKFSFSNGQVRLTA